MRYILLFVILSLVLLTACTVETMLPTSVQTQPLPTRTPVPTSLPTLPPTPTPEWGIAFAAVSPDMTTGPGPTWPLSLHLIHRDGSGLTPLTGEMEYITNLTASPDGRYLLFAAYRQDTDGDGSAGSIDLPHLHIASVQTGEVFTLTSGSISMEQVAAWSPDGEQIVFASSEVNANNRVRITESHTYLYVIKRNGTGKVKLIPQEGMIYAVAWSPTGEQILFNQNGAIWVVNPDGSGLSRIVDSIMEHRGRPQAAWPAWSPDGRWIAFIAPGIDRESNPDIYITSPDGSGLFNLTSHSAEDFQPAWSPDGQHIAFVTARKGNWAIYVANATDGSDVREMFYSPVGSAEYPAWSPDGSQIAFVVGTGKAWENRLCVVNIIGNDPYQLSELNVGDRPAWVLMPTQ